MDYRTLTEPTLILCQHACYQAVPWTTEARLPCGQLASAVGPIPGMISRLYLTVLLFPFLYILLQQLNLAIIRSNVTLFLSYVNGSTSQRDLVSVVEYYRDLCDSRQELVDNNDEYIFELETEKNELQERLDLVCPQLSSIQQTFEALEAAKSASEEIYRRDQARWDEREQLRREEEDRRDEEIESWLVQQEREVEALHLDHEGRIARAIEDGRTKAATHYDSIIRDLRSELKDSLAREQEAIREFEELAMRCDSTIRDHKSSSKLFREKMQAAKSVCTEQGEHSEKILATTREAIQMAMKEYKQKLGVLTDELTCAHTTCMTLQETITCQANELRANEASAELCSRVEDLSRSAAVFTSDSTQPDELNIISVARNCNRGLVANWKQPLSKENWPSPSQLSDSVTSVSSTDEENISVLVRNLTDKKDDVDFEPQAPSSPLISEWSEGDETTVEDELDARYVALCKLSPRKDNGLGLWDEDELGKLILDGSDDNVDGHNSYYYMPSPGLPSETVAEIDFLLRSQENFPPSVSDLLAWSDNCEY